MHSCRDDGSRQARADKSQIQDEWGLPAELLPSEAERSLKDQRRQEQGEYQTGSEFEPAPIAGNTQADPRNHQADRIWKADSPRHDCDNAGDEQQKSYRRKIDLMHSKLFGVPDKEGILGLSFQASPALEPPN